MSKNKAEVIDDILQKLDGNSIPVRTAVFHRTVQSYGANGSAGEPETAFYDAASKSKPSRTAEMFYTPHGLLCKQKYGTSLIPLANVCFVRVI